MGRHREFNMREMRGLAIVAKGGMIRRIGEGVYTVRSSDLERCYKVWWNGKDWLCECEDFRERNKPCKHVYAVLFLHRLPFMWMSNFQEGVKCKHCGSSNVIRKGFDHNKGFATQRYYCKDCKRRFNDKGNIRGLKGNPLLFIAAVDLYFKGLSFRTVKDHLEKVYAADVSYPTICRWVHKAIKLLKALVGHVKIESAVWHVDETTIKVGGDPRYIWNVIDEETRFLIAAVLTQGRSVEEAEFVLKEALKSTSSQPKKVITDGLSSYAIAIKNTMNDVEHIKAKINDPVKNNNIAERLHQTIKGRIKACKKISSDEATKELLEGFRLYYNFLRPNVALNGKSPYEMLITMSKRRKINRKSNFRCVRA